MSSTNRGGKRSEADFYETPAWCVQRLLETVPMPYVNGRWLEPCAGNGAIIRAVKRTYSGSDRKILGWTACELRPECESALREVATDVRIGDFLAPYSLAHAKPTPFYDVCITNPPYSLAGEFVSLCLPLAAYTVMLLRLNYLGSEGRAEMHRWHPPDISVLPNRPSFCLNAKGRAATDSIEYAWFSWHGMQERASGVLRVLASTPKEVRREHAQRLTAAALVTQSSARKEADEADERDLRQARRFVEDDEGDGRFADKDD